MFVMVVKNYLTKVHTIFHQPIITKVIPKMTNYYHIPKLPESVGKLFLEISKQCKLAEDNFKNGKFDKLCVNQNRIQDALSKLEDSDSQLTIESVSWIQQHDKRKKENGKCDCAICR